MNRYEADVLTALIDAGTANQRTLSAKTGYSLGVINRSLKNLRDEGLIGLDNGITSKAADLIGSSRPEHAIILAAGYGMRMVPINMEMPKGLLKVKGQRLIERTIEQLHEAGITSISVVVGFLMEQYEYLIDKYGVELIYNSEYSVRNNLHSLRHASKELSNSYVIPCDVWCEENPYSKTEFYSWYMVSDKQIPNSDVRITRDLQITRSDDGNGARMIGIAYINSDLAPKLKERLEEMSAIPAYDNSFWEAALFALKEKVCARIVRDDAAVEINTYEQLREFDSNSNHLQSEAIATIADVLDADPCDITDIEILKKGMTNRSFIFTCRNRRYIMRIPGEGTDLLIDRYHEADVYKAISGRGFCDDPVYLEPSKGYKIIRYLDNVRSLDPESGFDLIRGMALLKKFHDSRIKVGHKFDIFGQIEYYEKLWDGRSSCYGDYQTTKENVFSLKDFIEENSGEYCLTHIDAVPDNFLFYSSESGEEKLQLTDWEYSGMQDPHVDLAMFSIYSFYSKSQVDDLIEIYFLGKCPDMTRIKIYCYVAACGLLWSNWCEFKRSLGVDFGEYSLRQYRYAKDFYRIAMKESERLGICIK